MNRTGNRGFYRWELMACLRVSGEDAPRFLQGQITNDLQKIKEGGAIYGLWLNQKGKVLADSFVEHKSDHEFRLFSYFSPAAVIRERLEAYVIADDVTIEDQTAEVVGFTVFDDLIAAKLMSAGCESFLGRRQRGPHWEIICPRSEMSAVSANLAGIPELTREDMEQRRIAAKIPAVPIDIGPADLPNEGGLEADAISYTKGCYLGQEVMARLKSMGQVRRRLVQLRGTGAAPDAPVVVLQAGRKVGELRSAVRDGANWMGLALVTLLQVKPNEKLTLGTDHGPEAAMVVEP